MPTVGAPTKFVHKFVANGHRFASRQHRKNVAQSDETVCDVGRQPGYCTLKVISGPSVFAGLNALDPPEGGIACRRVLVHKSLSFGQGRRRLQSEVIYSGKFMFV